MHFSFSFSGNFVSWSTGDVFSFQPLMFSLEASFTKMSLLHSVHHPMDSFLTGRKNFSYIFFQYKNWINFYLLCADMQNMEMFLPK